MPIYNIAKLTVYMNPQGDTLKTRAKPYLHVLQSIPPSQCDIVIHLDKEQVAYWQKKYNHISYDSAEYHWFSYCFFKQSIQHNSLFIHSSAVMYKDNVYLFSAPKGTGKSTHTKLWQQYFGDDCTVIINDDKPLVTISSTGNVMAYGNPFSGKNDISSNTGGKLAGICFLHRGKENTVQSVSTDKALPLILSQTLVPKVPSEKLELIRLIDKLLQMVSVYNMNCTMSTNAVMTSYNAMKPTREE